MSFSDNVTNIEPTDVWDDLDRRELFYQVEDYVRFKQQEVMRWKRAIMKMKQRKLEQQQAEQQKQQQEKGLDKPVQQEQQQQGNVVKTVSEEGHSVPLPVVAVGPAPESPYKSATMV